MKVRRLTPQEASAAAYVSLLMVPLIMASFAIWLSVAR